MHPLVQYIAESLAEKIAAVPDIYAAGFRLPLTGDDMPAFNRLIGDFSFDSIWADTHIIGCISENEGFGTLDLKHVTDSRIAYGIAGHDLNNMAVPAAGYLQTYIKRIKHGAKSPLEMANKFAACLPTYRAMLSLIPYISSGGTISNFGQISQGQLEHILYGVDRFEVEGEDWIPEPILGALYQLVENAQFATRRVADGHVHVSARRIGKYNTLEVKDNGMGLKKPIPKASSSGKTRKKYVPMTEDDIPQIFETFSTTGGGLGLQVVRRVMELQKGLVTVTSTSNGVTRSYNNSTGAWTNPPSAENGTTFSLVFPKVR